MSSVQVEALGEPGKAYQKLLSIPPEIWASITMNITGEQLSRLKMTGDTKFWDRLCATRALRSVFLGRNGCPFKRWPAYLSDLPSIDELHIYNATEPWLHEWPVHLLPRTLRSLKIEARNTFTSRVDDLHLGDRLPNLEKLHINIDWSSKNHWITGSKWEKLVSLECWSWDCSIPLPANLTSLVVSEVSPRPDSGNLAFPRALESLTFHCKSLHLLMPLLPPNLISITEFVYGRPKNGTFTADFLIQLPKSLTDVKLTTSNAIFDQRLNEPLFHFHPVCLDVTYLPSQYWAYLPRTLKSLTIDVITPADATVFRALPDPNGSGTLHYNTIPIANLPPSITKLNLAFQEFAIVDVPSSPAPSDTPSSADQTAKTLFPPLLQHLKLEQAQLSTEASKQLPASLATLSLSHLSDGICQHLTQRLLSLESDNVTLTPQLIKYLPRSLTSLRLQAMVQRRRQAPNNQLLTIASLVSKGTNMNPEDGFWEGECCLPTGLKRLSLIGFDGLEDSIILNQRLTQLEDLEVKAPLLTDAIIPHLPRHLTSLKLELSKLITGKCFHHLPRHLRTLDLNRSSEIWDADIQHLPPYLTLISLGSAVNLTNACVKDFPRTLVNIHMLSNEKITIDSINDMPFQVRWALNSYGSTFLNRSWSIYQGKATSNQRSEEDDDEM